MGADIVWENVTVETEEIIDDNPLVWLDSAKEAYNRKHYIEAMDKTNQAKAFAKERRDIIFSADMLDFNCCMDIRDYEEGIQRLKAYSTNEISVFFSEQPDQIKKYLHMQLPTNIDSELNDYWKKVVERWLYEDKLSLVYQNMQDIDSGWLCNKVSYRHIEQMIKENYVELLKFLVRGGYSLSEYRDIDGSNVIQKAVEYDNITVLKYLLELGSCNVNNCDDDGNDALLFALANNSLVCVKELLKFGVKTNKVYHKKITLSALQLAIKVKCDLNIISCLLDNRADVHYVNPQGCDAIRLVVEEIFAKRSVKYYMDRIGLDVSVAQRIYERQKSKDAEHDLCEILESLLAHGARLDNELNRSLLCEVCRKPNVTAHLLSRLIFGGADLFYCDYSGHDGFYYSVKNNNEEAALLLLDWGVNINKQYEDGNTALHIIAQGKHWSGQAKGLWKALLNRRPNVNIRNNMGYTPLMNSVNHKWTFSDELAMARALVKAGADTNIQSNYGDTVERIMQEHNIDSGKLYNNSSSNFFTKLFSNN